MIIFGLMKIYLMTVSDILKFEINSFRSFHRIYFQAPFTCISAAEEYNFPGDLATENDSLQNAAFTPK